MGTISQNTSIGNINNRTCITYTTQAGIAGSGANTFTKKESYWPREKVSGNLAGVIGT
jgi:hypothetical protein